MAKDFVLTWTDADDNGDPVIGHDVSYTPDGGPEVIVATGSGSTGYTIGGLTDGTAYTVKVRAENSGGVGPWSTSVSKLAATVPGVPLSPGTLPDSTTSISVAWNAPSSDGGSPITGYSIRYTPTAGGSATVVAHSSATTNYTITGLAEATSYDIEVAAINVVGTGAYSSAVTASTQGSTSGGIAPNTDGSARFYLPATSTTFSVGASTSTGFYRITDGTILSAVAGMSYYATTSNYSYAYFMNASLTGLSSSNPKTIELYSCDAAGNRSGSLVFVNLTPNSSPVDAVDLSGLGLSGAALFSATAYSSPPYKFSMSSGASSMPASISEIRAVSTSFRNAGAPNTYSQYYYGGGLDITAQNLDAPQLDQLYSDIGANQGGVLLVRGNPGTASDTPSIASAKGYTVYGS